MDEQRVDAAHFRDLAPSSLGFVEAYGFKRARDIEVTSPTIGTVVYVGNHLGLVFSLDVRDQCVDARVVQVLNGSVQGPAHGAYSSDLFMHLVKRHGYRGQVPAGSAVTGCGAQEARIKEMLDGWAQLIQRHADDLVRDDANWRSV